MGGTVHAAAEGFHVGASGTAGRVVVRWSIVTPVSDAGDEWLLVLRGGVTVRIRPLQAGDEPRVRRFFEQLTLHTRYLRFFSPVPGVPEALVRTLAAIDDERRLTLVAELDHERAGELVAVGNLVAVDERRAEAALVVADEWQRKGIGVEVVRRLLDAGERRGVEHFVVHGLWNNAAVRALLDRTADIVSTEMHSGVAEFTFVPRRHASSDVGRLGHAIASPDAVRHGPALGHSVLEQAYQRVLLTKGRTES